MIPGIKLDFGGNEFEVPPLNFRSLEQLQDRIANIGNLSGAITPEQMATVVDVIHAALKRNYPNMSRDDVVDRLDLGNMAKVFMAVMGASGLETSTSGEPTPAA